MQYSFKLISFFTMLVWMPLFNIAVASNSPQISNAQAEKFQRFITEMRESQKGPFSKVVWYCHNGKILPPKAYACTPNGGGVQHGQYSAQADEIRAAGFPIANVYADYLRKGFSPPNYSDLSSLLLDRFLNEFDDGWIMRQARFYRGALQIEDESRGGDLVLNHLATNVDDIERKFLLLREAAKWFPNSVNQEKLSRVRGLVTIAAEKDSGFTALKNKIHNWPDIGDVQRVRAYGEKQADAKQREYYESIALELAESYKTNENLTANIIRFARRTSDSTQAREFRKLAVLLDQPLEATKRFAALNRLMYMIRDSLPTLRDIKSRSLALQVSLEAERMAYIAGTELSSASASMSREKLLRTLYKSVQGIYGMGFINRRELQQLQETLLTVMRKKVKLGHWRDGLEDFALVTEWSVRRFEYYFGETIRSWAVFEPLAEQYVVERLRASPAIFLSQLVDKLQTDANKMAGIENTLFGASVGTGMRSLNPGLTKGILLEAPAKGESFKENGIYLLPNTIATLPKVAGILTLAEGNSLSHVQLLARNLGIPNVVINEALVKKISKYYGRKVVMAASPAGLVELALDKGQFNELFAKAKPKSLKLPIEQLDFSKKLWTLDELGAEHSGKIAGPKATKLAELNRMFRGTVSPALVIPFGYFNDLLSKVEPKSGLSRRQWLKKIYGDLEIYKSMDPSGYEVRLRHALKNMRDWIEKEPLPVGLVAELRRKTLQVFGTEGSYGVFVRSDTNVEDLPNFSGAGLNKTVHHVVGFENLLKAIKKVWASPFTVRAFNWRQAVLDKPEHVYASVLLHQSVAVDTSGVAVTMNMRNGDTNFTTVVANEGVGGGVDGQPAETMIIDNQRKKQRLLSSATAIVKRVLRDRGGSELVPATDAPVLLNLSRIQRLREVVQTLNNKFPEAKDAAGNIVPLDIEYGFINDKLSLFQVRPFVRNKRAEQHQYLLDMDNELQQRYNNVVDINAPAAIH